MEHDGKEETMNRVGKYLRFSEGSEIRFGREKGTNKLVSYQEQAYFHSKKVFPFEVELNQCKEPQVACRSRRVDRILVVSNSHIHSPLIKSR